VSPVQKLSAIDRAVKPVPEAPAVPSPPGPAPAALPTGRPVRFTLDMSRAQHRQLQDFARGIGAPASMVMRALVRELFMQADLQGLVRQDVEIQQEALRKARQF
jgi:hypothetical protein